MTRMLPTAPQPPLHPLEVEVGLEAVQEQCKFWILLIEVCSMIDRHYS